MVSNRSLQIPSKEIENDVITNQVPTFGSEWGSSHLWQWDGFDCHWRVLGPENSQPLVLIHGFGVSKKTWDSSTLLLSKNYHLFSVDLRGMGKSGRITPQHSRFDWVTDINCLINKIFKSPGYLVGHSLGGWICAGVASLNHKKVRAIALGDPFTGVDTIKSSNRKKIKIQEIRTKKSVRTYKELIVMFQCLS